MNTENQSIEIESANKPREWQRADTLRVAQVIAAALLLGLMLRVMSDHAPVTPVAAKPAPNPAGVEADQLAHTTEGR